MGELKITNEKVLNYIEVVEKLKEIEKRDGKLSFRTEKTKEYLNMLSKMHSKDTKKLYKALENLNIPRLRDKQISKIVEVLPKDMDSLKIVLSGEALNLKTEDLKKIIETTKEY